MFNFSDFEIPEFRIDFKFEEECTLEYGRNFLRKNWKSSFYFVAAYLVLIPILKLYMRNRKPYDLRRSMIAWNLGLMMFSLMGTFKAAPFLYRYVRDLGFYGSVCFPEYHEKEKSLLFWAQLFGYSKVVELGDTAFIILRKQPLIFLHWYHHATVLLYCWFSGHDENGPALWFAVMNGLAHTFMYFYYAMKAAKYGIPRTVSMIITTVQLAQMIMAVFVTTYAYVLKSRGVYCGVADKTLNVSFLMYFSYFLLFSHFFYKTYVHKFNIVQRCLKAFRTVGTKTLQNLQDECTDTKKVQ